MVDVQYALPKLEIANTGITFTRKVDNHMHGEITVRKNHIDWRPSGNEKVFSVTWEAFSEFAESFKSKHTKTTPVKAKKKLKK